MFKYTKFSFIGIILILTTLFIIFDFYKFYNLVHSFKNNEKIYNNLVVLTGGTNRIKDTLKTFFSNKPNKINLLISGAGKGFSKKTLKNLFSSEIISEEIVECCIEIENKSKNTISNAVETLKWVKKNNFKTITLITSDYHMPRAIIEFKNIISDLKISTYILTTSKDNFAKKFKNYFFEYLKYSLVKIKLLIYDPQKHAA